MGRGQVQIIQMTAAPDYCRRLGTFTITAVNQGAKRFTIAENVEDRINDGGLTELTVQQCTMPGGNDGTYTIVSATWDTDHTDIVVSEAISSAVVEGEIVLVNDYDSYTDKLPIVSAENQPMWELANDKIYFGCLTAWAGFGVILSTFGSYGAFTWEYLDASLGLGNEVWREFTPMNDTTYGFSFPGVINWGVLSGWDEFTVDGDSAFWVRATPATIDTVATFFNLLRSITADRPLKYSVGWDRTRFYYSTEGNLEKTDIAKETPTHASCKCSQPALKMIDLNTIVNWVESRVPLWIIDLAQTNPPDLTKDAYYRVLKGRMDKFTEDTYSPEKMQCMEYQLDFLIDDAISVTQAIASYEFKPPPGEQGGEYGWYRDEGTVAMEGDGGDAFPPGQYKSS